jgi:hypothetical protein
MPPPSAFCAQPEHAVVHRRHRPRRRASLLDRGVGVAREGEVDVAAGRQISVTVCLKISSSPWFTSRRTIGSKLLSALAKSSASKVISFDPER